MVEQIHTLDQPGFDTTVRLDRINIGIKPEYQHLLDISEEMDNKVYPLVNYIPFIFQIFLVLVAFFNLGFKSLVPMIGITTFIVIFTKSMTNMERLNKVNKYYKNIEKDRNFMDFSFCHESIEIKSDFEHTLIKWDEVKRIRETEKFLHIILKQRVVLIPKDSFTNQGQLLELKDLVKSCLPDDKLKLRSGVYQGFGAKIINKIVEKRGKF